MDREFAGIDLIGNSKNIRPAANLAILDVALPGASRFVNGCLIPLTTACALESAEHFRL
jgi:hypothetical protein